MPNKAEFLALADEIGREICKAKAAKNRFPRKPHWIDPVRDGELLAKASIEVFRKTLEEHRS
jgi:hypothetical protein